MGKVKGTKGGDKQRRTRPLEGNEDWYCQRHDLRVKPKKKYRLDEDGKKKYAGEYYQCPSYWECGYYVSLRDKTVPVVDDDGIALGKKQRLSGKK